MSIRIPAYKVLDVTHTNQGSTSVAGGWAYPFKVPQDTDNVVVKLAPSVVAGGMSAIFQTSDDGGTTWYDVARTSIASNSGATAVSPAAAQWLSIPVSTGLSRNVPVASLIATGSLVAGVFNGSASASTLASGQSSGLPLLGIQNRVFLVSTGNATSISTRVIVLANSQSSGN